VLKVEKTELLRLKTLSSTLRELLTVR
jgi:hypothetical protein